MKQNSKAILLMVFCTFAASIGQAFAKVAGSQVAFTLAGTLFNWAYYVSLILLGVSAILMIYAFKIGDLSRLFPLIVLSFIWTLLIAVFFFGEIITVTTMIGIVLILAGVITLGRAGDTV